MNFLKHKATMNSTVSKQNLLNNFPLQQTTDDMINTVPTQSNEQLSNTCTEMAIPESKVVIATIPCSSTMTEKQVSPMSLYAPTL